MEEHQKKAFDFAADYSKQLITLATAIVTFMVTFVPDIFAHAPVEQKLFLLGAWGIYLISIGFGIWKQMALTGNLDPKSGTPNFSINSLNIQFPAISQIITFLLAVLLTGVFGCQRVFQSAQKPETKRAGIVVIQERGSDKQVVVSQDTVLVK